MVFQTKTHAKNMLILGFTDGFHPSLSTFDTYGISNTNENRINVRDKNFKISISPNLGCEKKKITF